MLRQGALIMAMVGTLSACGHTPEERVASGLLIGGAIGAVVGLASEPGYDHYEDRDRHYHRRDHRRHRVDNRRRHRDWDDYDDHEDYGGHGCRSYC